MTTDMVKDLIKQGLSGATVEVTDERNTGDHFNAIVEWDGFEGLSLIEQHRKVYDSLGEYMTQGIHALGLKTVVPEKV